MQLPGIILLYFLFFLHEDPVPAGRNKDLSGISVSSVESIVTPLFTGVDNNSIITIHFRSNTIKKLKGLAIEFSRRSNENAISGINLLCGSEESSLEQLTRANLIMKGRKSSNLRNPFSLDSGKYKIIIRIGIKSNAILSEKLVFDAISLILDDGSSVPVSIDNIPEYRLAKILRAKGEDDVDTYRIPGLITTSIGTLIAVYDIRHNNSKDLQEDIDIGMSRSTDGGQTWQPMKVIMDMGEYGGKPQNINGTGDPCILYDSNTGTIWVAALWMSGLQPGQGLWFSSKPGTKPDETGQFLLVKSSDDGITWSEPVNITSQVKDPSWQLLFQGPGKGIVMKNGTLVFPAQFKASIGSKAIDGGEYTSHATIVYSNDGGETWKTGNGAKANTTESQVVELSHGTLMLNMRDDLNRKDKGETNGRAVAITRDMGSTWTVHPSSNHLLPEPNCQASLISADLHINGLMTKVLFFSNPANRYKRTDMTIKASIDEGMSWPEEFQIRLNQNEGFGYSCLTMVDKETIGIVYEGVKELYFQKVPVKDLLTGK